MKKMNGEGLNLLEKNIEFIKELFPNCVENDVIDFNSLRIALGDSIEEKDEKYSFLWPGKSISIKNALSPSKSTLIPKKNKSLEWNKTQNIYIEGDNLETLKVLLKTYYRKVKMIYIDPPYNTGNDFVYNDNFAKRNDDYINFSNQNYRSNPESSGRFHTDWLNMMYPRLRVARELLEDDGIIFISIDENEIHNLRKICDEIFGENCFVSQLGWQKVYSPKNQAKYFSNDYEFVLCYAKNIDAVKINDLPRTDEMNQRYKNPDNDPRGAWKPGDCVGNGERKNGHYDVVSPTGKIYNVPAGKHWVYAPETMEAMIRDNRIWFGKDGNSFPAVKQFLSEVGGRKASSLLLHEDFGHTDMAKKDLIKLFPDLVKPPFDTPKPVKLLKMLSLLGMGKDDLILDFFSGSGTTAESIFRLNSEDGGNRKFVLVQIEEPLADEETIEKGFKTICDIGEERIRRASKKIYDELKAKNESAGLLNDDIVDPDSLDLGFKVFKLESSNIKAWDSSLKLDETSLLDQLETIKEDRTDLDVAYEIMLKYGVFNMPLEEVKINNKIMFNVGKGFLIIDLNIDTTLDDVEAIGKEKPHCVVFKESGFKDDNAKLNAVKTLETFGVQDIRCL